MKEIINSFIKDHFEAIALSMLFLIIGIVVGISCQKDKNGIYYSMNYPDNGGVIFKIGSDDMSVSRIDLSTFSEVDSSTLITKIKNLSTDNLIAKELIHMVKESQGIFKSVPVELNLHFVDNDSAIAGPLVKVCKNTPVYNNSLLIVGVDGVHSDVLIKKGMIGLSALQEQQINCDAVKPDAKSYDIWVNRNYIEQWLGNIEKNREFITVKAKIVVSGMTII